MNDFDWGVTFGRFFMSWIINDDFCGIAIRIGKEMATDAGVKVIHFTMQLGYLQFTVGVVGSEE